LSFLISNTSSNSSHTLDLFPDFFVPVVLTVEDSESGVAGPGAGAGAAAAGAGARATGGGGGEKLPIIERETANWIGTEKRKKRR
jgi:hypothetical protein